MIKWKWKRNSNGEPLTRIRVAHTLSREDLANLLAAHWQANSGDLTKSVIEARIREQLMDSPRQMYYWQEGYSDEEAEEIKLWAECQVAKL